MTREQAILILGLTPESELERGDRYVACTGELVRYARRKLSKLRYVEVEIEVGDEEDGRAA